MVGPFYHRTKMMKDEIKQYLEDHGASLVGFADLSAVPLRSRRRFPRAIAFAVALDSKVVHSITKGPTKEYFDECERANTLLGKLSESLSEMLNKRGFQAIPSAATGVGIDPQTHSTILPHKTVATLAGLGWIGKCALLVTPEFGSAVRLNCVLTHAPFETATPITRSRCGNCRACVEACPGNAPSGANWNTAQHRDTFFDPFACRRAARKIAKQRTGLEDTFCGICMAVCPFSQSNAAKRSIPLFNEGVKRPKKKVLRT